MLDYDVISKIWLRQSMCIYFTILPNFKFHPNAIRNDGALDLFEEVAPTTEDEQDQYQYGISSWSKKLIYPLHFTLDLPKQLNKLQHIHLVQDDA